MAELVLALDLPDERDALAMLERLPDARWVKIGSVLFTGAGPTLVARIKDQGRKVFLDLKWHDIPNTVAGAVAQVRALGVDMVTVHALGGGKMMAAAKEAAGSGCAVVAVTVLTSHDGAELARILGRSADPTVAEVLRLADAAREAGVDGVVSSPLETAALRERLGPAALLVTPGIRLPTEAKGDQARTATAAAAADAGATHLVVGRPILNAADPAGAWAALEASLR